MSASAVLSSRRESLRRQREAHSASSTTDLPLVILPDSESRELENVSEDPKTELEVASNTTSSGHYGICGPFLDSVYLLGTAELNPWAAHIFDKAIRARGSRFYWPLEAVVVERTHVQQLDKQVRPPVGIRFLVGAKYFEGHQAYPVEFCGTGSLQGVRVLVGPERAGRHAFKIFISPTQLWALRSEHADYGEVIERIQGFLSGPSIIPGDFPFATHEINGAEIHDTIDTWGHDWDISQADNMVTLRDSSVGESASGSDAYSVEIDNDQPFYSKKYRLGQTIYLGNRGTDHRQTCIYNKLAHAQLNGSITYLEPKWRDCGWNGTDRVWRIEVRHGTGWLKAHNFDVKQHFKDCERALFAKYLDQVRLIDPTTSERKRRCKLHPFWAFLRQSIMTPHANTWIWKPRPMKIDKDAVKLTQMAVGCTASLIELVQNHAPNLRPSKDPRSCWSRESVMEYQHAKDHVLHELSSLIDEKVLGKRTTPEDIAATIHQLQASLAAEAFISGGLS